MSDSISRQDAIEGVKELFACADIGNDEYDITYMLENLPSADRPTGEWIEEDEYGDLLVCDQCGFASEHRDNYCPNCGAKMGGESE